MPDSRRPPTQEVGGHAQLYPPLRQPGSAGTWFGRGCLATVPLAKCSDSTPPGGAIAEYPVKGCWMREVSSTETRSCHRFSSHNGSRGCRSDERRESLGRAVPNSRHAPSATPGGEPPWPWADSPIPRHRSAHASTPRSPSRFLSIVLPPGYWGGTYTASNGENVTVAVSDYYFQDPAGPQSYAEFFATGLIHGPELAQLAVVVVEPLPAVQRTAVRTRWLATTRPTS